MSLYCAELRSLHYICLLHFYLLKLLFYIGVQSVNNAVVISGAQQKDLVKHKHVSILTQTPLPERLPHNIEQSSLCSTVGHCWLSILNIAVYYTFIF